MKPLKVFSTIFCLILITFSSCLAQVQSYIGVTSAGGTYNGGTIITGKTDGSSPNVLFQFNQDQNGAVPLGGVIKGPGGDYYGTCSIGGENKDGIVYKISAAGVFTELGQFDDTKYGSTPTGRLVMGADSTLYGTCNIGGTSNLGTVFKVSPAGVLSKIADFTSADGSFPSGALAKGSDGNYYGMCNSGGTHNLGTIFKVSTAGVITKINDLSDGSNPIGSLLSSADGDFYGTCSEGGDYEGGTIFKIDKAGSLDKLFDFTLSKSFVMYGNTPSGGLVAGDRSLSPPAPLYGTCSSGGYNNNGTIFNISASGNFDNMYELSATQGSDPVGSLTLGADGKLYGVCNKGGVGGSGTVFSISTSGMFTKIRDLSATDGANPVDGLLLVAGTVYFHSADIRTDNEQTIDCIMYPNPSDGNVTLDLGKNYNDIKVTVSDISGRNVMNSSFTSGRVIHISTGSLPQGVYFMKINSPKGICVKRMEIMQAK